MKRLLEYGFPGNVRELENIIEQAFVLCRGGVIELDHLPLELRPPAAPAASLPATTDIKGMERQMIRSALDKHKGHRAHAARELGIDPSTLYRKMKSLGIGPPPEDGRARAS
jgi:transcriptional regulator of acetoin/glycerol metabolism